MSEFEDEENFVNEFAYRTQLNYYNARLQQLRDAQFTSGRTDDEKTLEERERIQEKIEQLKEEMFNRQYALSDFYEVTQLINSIIGLLVFPQQKYFGKIPQGSLDQNIEEFPVLYSLIQRGDFDDTYRFPACRDGKFRYFHPVWEMNPKEIKSAKLILKHLRNSVAHFRVMIHPVNGKEEDGKRAITGVSFEDACLHIKKKGKWVKDDSWERANKKIIDYKDGVENKWMHFYLFVPVEQLEPLLMEISSYFMHMEIIDQA